MRRFGLLFALVAASACGAADYDTFSMGAGAKGEGALEFSQQAHKKLRSLIGEFKKALARPSAGKRKKDVETIAKISDRLIAYCTVADDPSYQPIYTVADNEAIVEWERGDIARREMVKLSIQRRPTSGGYTLRVSVDDHNPRVSPDPVKSEQLFVDISPRAINGAHTTRHIFEFQLPTASFDNLSTWVDEASSRDKESIASRIDDFYVELNSSMNAVEEHEKLRTVLDEANTIGQVTSAGFRRSEPKTYALFAIRESSDQTISKLELMFDERLYALTMEAEGVDMPQRYSAVTFNRDRNTWRQIHQIGNYIQLTPAAP